MYKKLTITILFICISCLGFYFLTENKIENENKIESKQLIIKKEVPIKDTPLNTKKGITYTKQEESKKSINEIEIKINPIIKSFFQGIKITDKDFEEFKETIWEYQDEIIFYYKKYFETLDKKYINKTTSRETIDKIRTLQYLAISMPKAQELVKELATKKLDWINGQMTDKIKGFITFEMFEIYTMFDKESAGNFIKNSCTEKEAYIYHWYIGRSLKVSNKEAAKEIDKIFGREYIKILKLQDLL